MNIFVEHNAYFCYGINCYVFRPFKKGLSRRQAVKKSQKVLQLSVKQNYSSLMSETCQNRIHEHLQ